jgi:hypothetical protein
MSNMDNCLFYKITEEETTFIVLLVDDTLIFSKRQLDIDQFVVSMNRHYEMTLDTKTDSFLGINIDHNEDGTVTLTQPKLLQKFFKEQPEQPSKRKARTPTHPYGPVPSHNKEKEQSPPIPVTTYYLWLLLGLLMHLTKSRPDIMAAVSFGATKSTNPTEKDYQQLYYIVDYLRVTASEGHRIFVHSSLHIMKCAPYTYWLRTYCSSYTYAPRSTSHCCYQLSS